MRRFLGVSFLALLVLAIASMAHAQDRRTDPTTLWPSEQTSDKVRPGMRVRLTLRPLPEHLTREKIVGLLVSLDNDNVVVSESPGAPERTLPLELVRKFEVNQGKHTRAGRGALIGAVSGAAGGVAAGLIVCADGDCVTSGMGDLKGTVSTVLGIGGGLFGAGMGALIGGRIHNERWETIPVRDLRMGLVPTGDGVRLRFSWAFR